jgi:mRNA-degrading endonuclease RelE of RelBE toxin-antitoxin system
MEHPRTHDSKPLVGAAYWRVDSGEYRVIYDWTPSAVRIVLIGKRKDDDVYERVKRR